MDPFFIICCYIHNNHCSPLAVRYLACLYDNTSAGCDPDVTFEAGDSSGTTLRHSEHVWLSWRHASPHSSVGWLFTPPLALLFVLSGCGTVTVSPSTCQTPAGVLGFINSSSPSWWMYLEPFSGSSKPHKHTCVCVYNWCLAVVAAAKCFLGCSSSLARFK